jgi:DNA invertase Pin-like site-specific DNA recombinase
LAQKLKEQWISDAWIPSLRCQSSAAAEQATFTQFTNDTSDTEAPDPPGNDPTEIDTDSEDTEKCVVMYVRVSTDEQKKEGRSIDSQISELSSIIERDDEISLYTEPIRDEGETGTDFDRDGISKIVSLARHDEVTHLMVDTIDRIGRSVAETLMFIHELREKYDVKIMTRGGESDVRKPTDRLNVTMKAAMADFGTRNRARSSLRSSADNFIQDKKWFSWYRAVPFGYESIGDDSDEGEDGDKDEDDTDDDWIERVEELEDVIKDIYSIFIEVENYTETASRINEKYAAKLEEYDGLEGSKLNYRQIRSVVSRPVYRGKPTIPVTELEHYDPNPSVDDPELRFVDDATAEKAQEIVEKIAEKNSTDDDLVIDPEDYPDEFDPCVIETVSSLVQLVCPECESPLIADGHQRQLDGDLGSRLYRCQNDDCGFSKRWPTESESELMELLSKADEFHSIL